MPTKLCGPFLLHLSSSAILMFNFKGFFVNSIRNNFSPNTIFCIPNYHGSSIISISSLNFQYSVSDLFMLRAGDVFEF